MLVICVRLGYTSGMPSVKQIRVRRTTLVSISCLTFLAGLGLARLTMWQPGVPVLLAGLLCIGFCRKRWAALAIVTALLGGLLLGVWRGGVMNAQLAGYQPYVGRRVTLLAVVQEDPTYTSKGMLDIRLGTVRLGGQALPGTMRATTFNPIQPHRGNVLQVSGKLYGGFGGYQAAVYYATTTVVGRRRSWFEDIRRSFTTNVLNAVPEPQASLGLGFLVGLKSQLPPGLYNQLRILGLMHIVVASGYNLTVLVRLARRLLSKRSKYQALAVTLVMIGGFVGVTGFSASMSRAALVTVLSLAAWYYGRRIHPVVLLAVSAAVTAAINPLYVWGDIGWWLSFLSFGGVMLGGPLLARRLYGTKQPPALIQVALETLCAQAATLPLILFIFGNFSVLALLANVLIVPLIPLAMLLTFIAGVAGWLVPPLAPWLALPASGLLGYMTNLTGWLSRTPWAMLLVPITVLGMVVLYALVLVFGWVLYKRTSTNYLQASVVE
jgi:competence protein ComEC